MQMTAASVPPTARYRWEYWGGRASNLVWILGQNYAALVLEDEVMTANDNLFTIDPAGNAVGHHIFHLGVALLVSGGSGALLPPPRRLPWSGDSVPPGRRPDEAFRPPPCRRREQPLEPWGRHRSGCRFCRIRWYPPRQRPPGICPPLTIIRRAEASRMAEMMEMGVDSLMAQE